MSRTTDQPMPHGDAEGGSSADISSEEVRVPSRECVHKELTRGRLYHKNQSFVHPAPQLRQAEAILLVTSTRTHFHSPWNHAHECLSHAMFVRPFFASCEGNFHLKRPDAVTGGESALQQGESFVHVDDEWLRGVSPYMSGEEWEYVASYDLTCTREYCIHRHERQPSLIHHLSF